jgi:hypothetical protein
MNKPTGGCLRHAFAVGLAYMGRQEDVSWIPDKANMDDIRSACERFSMTLIDELGEFNLGQHTPVLICYRTDERDDNGDLIDHAVFASDAKPFERLLVICTVIGWNGNHVYQRVDAASS